MTFLAMFTAQLFGMVASKREMRPLELDHIVERGNVTIHVYK